MMGDSVIYYVEQADKPVNRAGERARKTFKYFWRELFWERRRIIPALDFAMVKAPFFSRRRRRRNLRTYVDRRYLF